VTRRRGGFCYELNGLFAWLLNQIGFEVTCLNGRVFNKRGGLGIDFDHLVLLVAIPGLSTRWLVDVGFGDSFVEPLPFEEGAVQIQGLYTYKVERADNGMALWRRNYERAWERQYFFDLEPRTFPNDYLAGCLYHQSSPQSSFTLGRVVSRATPEGRITLDDNRLIMTTNGRREELPVQNEVEFHKLLKKHFDIKL
jgi:N-hydroxyarylamine O-acetyltransferase